MTLPDMNGGVPFVDGQEFTAAHSNSARVSITRAVDGVAGGTFAPSPAITIQGDGLTVSGQFTASGATTLSGATTISNTTTHSGANAKTYWRRGTRLAPGANTTIDVSKDYWKFTNPAGLPTSCVVTAPTGEPAGLVVRAFTVDQLTDTITFKDVAATMVTFVTGTAAKQYVEFMWDGSAWEVVNVSANATLAAGY